MVSPPAWWKSSRAGCDTYIGTPNAYEWQYHIAGQARMGVFGSSEDARTFDFRAGDVGYVPFAMGHYIENTGVETLGFLEPFGSPVFADVSLNQWMALPPPELVQGHLMRVTRLRAARYLNGPLVSYQGLPTTPLGGSSLHW